jgi:hypothetical protein
MGKAKPLTISGLHFLKQGEALEYFMSKRPELMNQSQITQGELFEALKDLYIRYCEKSPGWELNGRLITQGGGRAHECSIIDLNNKGTLNCSHQYLFLA